MASGGRGYYAMSPQDLLLMAMQGGQGRDSGMSGQYSNFEKMDEAALRSTAMAGREEDELRRWMEAQSAGSGVVKGEGSPEWQMLNAMGNNWMPKMLGYGPAPNEAAQRASRGGRGGSSRGTSAGYDRSKLRGELDKISSSMAKMKTDWSDSGREGKIEDSEEYKTKLKNLKEVKMLLNTTTQGGLSTRDTGSMSVGEGFNIDHGFDPEPGYEQYLQPEKTTTGPVTLPVGPRHSGDQLRLTAKNKRDENQIAEDVESEITSRQNFQLEPAHGTGDYFPPMRAHETSGDYDPGPMMVSPRGPGRSVKPQYEIPSELAIELKKIKDKRLPKEETDLLILRLMSQLSRN